MIESVTDREILQAYQFLAEKEGVFVEPACGAGSPFYSLGGQLAEAWTIE